MNEHQWYGVQGHPWAMRVGDEGAMNGRRSPRAADSGPTDSLVVAPSQFAHRTAAYSLQSQVRHGQRVDSEWEESRLTLHSKVECGGRAVRVGADLLRTGPSAERMTANSVKFDVHWVSESHLAHNCG